MPAIKFPKSNNGSLAKTGNPSSQSIGTIKKSKKISSLSSSVLDKASLSALPPSPDAYLSTVQSANVSTFEVLTNISSQRPEIISFLPFQPIYEDYGNLTTAGQLFDSLIEYTRALDESSKDVASENFSSTIASKNKKFEEDLEKIRRMLKNFYDVYRSLGKVRKSLNINSEYYDFSPTAFVNSEIADDVDVDKEILSLYATKMPEEINVKSTITNLRNASKTGGFKTTDAEAEKLSSTTSFLYLLHEVRRITDYHSQRLSQEAENDAFVRAMALKGDQDNWDRKFVYVGHKRTDLRKWAASPIDNSNFSEISNFTIEEDLQKSIDALQGKYAELSDGGFPEAEKVIVLLEENVTENTNYTGLKNLALDMISYFRWNNKYFSDKLLNYDAIAVIFKLLSKEVRRCKKFTPDLMNSFGEENLQPSLYSSRIFGDLASTSDLYTPVKLRKNSLQELAQFAPPDGSKKVLLFKQNSPSNGAVEAGGDYYFDPELLINFSSTASTTGSLTDVSIRARIIELSNMLDKKTADFHKCATEMGLLLQKDEKIFDGEKPNFFSNNPEKYLDNVWNAIKGHIAVAPGTKLGFKNTEMGIKAMIAYAGKQDDDKSVFLLSRLYLFALSDIYEQEIEDYGNLNQILATGFGVLNNAKSLPSDIRRGLVTIARGIVYGLGLDLYGDDDEFKLVEQRVGDNLTETVDGDKSKKWLTDWLMNQYQELGVYPCLFDTMSELGSTLRKDKLYLAIVDVLKDLRKTLEIYAVNPSTTTTPQAGDTSTPPSSMGTNTTKFSNVTINSIMALMFSIICRLVNATSPYKIKHSALASFMGTFGLENSAYVGTQGGNAEVIKLLQGLGLFPKNANKVHAVSMYVEADLSSYESQRDIVTTVTKNKISQEMKLETMGVLTVMNTLNVLNKNIKNIKEMFEKLSIDDYNTLLRYVDKSKLNFLLKEPQLTLAMSNVEDLHRSFQNFSIRVDDSSDNSKQFFTQYYESLHYSDKMVDSLKRFFSSQEFKSSKGYNKKIISVGLAQDLLKNTLPKYDFEKQNDIIKLSIYKIDNLNPDVIYRPKSYLFESSRYPSRVYSDYEHDLDSLQSIPTRNYSVTPDARGIDQGETASWNDISNSFGDEYSFLSQEEKEEIIENQAMSTLLENYIKIVTGLVINETSFNLNASETLALLRELTQAASSDEFKKSAVNSFYNKATTGPKKNPSPKIPTLNFMANFQNYLEGPLTTIARAVGMPPEAYFRYLLQPKKFDRIFNIIFDPEFEIDVKKTRSTPVGDKVLTRLINERKIATEEKNYSIFFPESKGRYYDVDKNTSDISIESFFVVLESYQGKKSIKNINSVQDSISKIPPSLISKITGGGLISKINPSKKIKDSNFKDPGKITSLDIGSLKDKLKL